jgi:tRNA (guanine37-N1)-methyltransferase
MMHFDVVTLFPEMFAAVTGSGITQRAYGKGHYELVLWNPREFSSNLYRSVDDRPYGGGPGMVMMPEPLTKALCAARQRQASAGVKRIRTVYLSPQGRPLTQRIVEDLGAYEGLVLLAGRYEGVDERLLNAEVEDQLSIGDYVLSGGELPAMVLMDALIRRIPGVLNDAESALQESFVNGLLDCPQYTRPEVYGGEAVPAVLLSGHHAQIMRWRMKQSLGRTWRRRPDLLANLTLSPEQVALLEEFQLEERRSQSKQTQELTK